ncbi:septum site-determining protein MinC [Paucibacter sp. R3-3]|uniref:Probable septum site-determining protein MinC n=1 Tax=Roseateles agri TaxID=3098619 RepID=A0ABU5DRQ3_9BURK|nr:septum site-determining protein MinC [Paucibacter sp. R3-3]MDY0748320.1 septum site-determining protein MinC [Paucibacter sp. R3-3]
MAQAQTTGKSSSARGAAVLELKSASLSLLALVLKSADPAELAAGLAEKLGDTPGMFSNDPVVIDLSQLERTPAVADPDAQGQLALEAAALQAVDLAAVVALLREHQMQPVAVQGATPEELEQAQALGLADASGQDLTRTRGAEPRTVVQEVEVVREVIREVAVPGEAAKTLIIDKPLRSGQQVYAKGADLVVMALVSHGAEVIADGSIHVYAPLRGKAIAGARGNADARIFSLSMEAELIAIAGIYRTTENPLPDNVLRKPAQIRLDGEKLVMEPF